LNLIVLFALVLSLLSSFEGGKNVLHFGVNMGVTAAFSLAIYVLALRSRLSPAEAEARIAAGTDEAPA
jgi:predicted Co/Zn/Cd cation transporter (cation efflux family)